MNFGTYAKAITAFVTGVIGWGYMVIASEPQAVTASEWMMLAAIAAGAAGVYQMPNAEPESGSTSV